MTSRGCAAFATGSTASTRSRWDVEALARGVHMTAGHLSREFKIAFGESPYSYLMTRRIERAMALLCRGHLTVTEVCSTVGCVAGHLQHALH